MRTPTISLLGFAAALVAGAAPAVADDSITLHAHQPKAGEKWTEEKVEITAVTVDANGKKVPVDGKKTLKKSVEVTKVSKDAITEEKVTYGAVTETSKVGGTDKPVPEKAFANKGYKLAAGTPVAVEALKGTASKDEVEAVRKEEKHFGKADRMDKLLDGKTFKKGVAVKLPSDEIAKAFADDDSVKSAEMSLTYKGTTGNIATFDVTLKMAGDTPNGHVVMDTAGTVTYDIKASSPVDMKVKGSLKLTGGKFPADGTIELTEHRTL